MIKAAFTKYPVVSDGKATRREVVGSGSAFRHYVHGKSFWAEAWPAICIVLAFAIFLWAYSKKR